MTVDLVPMPPFPNRRGVAGGSYLFALCRQAGEDRP